ncbi:PspA/IM30 family protein [Paenibacillus sp. YSY-4.3]
MGILSRFRDIMRANVNSFVDRAEDPAKAMDEYMRTLLSDLGKVKAEAAAVLADERRAKASLDECQAEIKKLQRYAEKAVEAGSEDDALKFLDHKAQQAAKLNELQQAHELAAAKAVSMQQLQEKLTSDLGQLEARHSEVKEKLALSRVQQDFGMGSSSSSGSFEELEEKAYFAAEEALALAELRAGETLDNAADPAAHLEQDVSVKPGVNSSTNSSTNSSASTPASVEDELAAIKARLNKKES